MARPHADFPASRQQAWQVLTTEYEQRWPCNIHSSKRRCLSPDYTATFPRSYGLERGHVGHPAAEAGETNSLGKGREIRRKAPGSINQHREQRRPSAGTALSQKYYTWGKMDVLLKPLLYLGVSDSTLTHALTHTETGIRSRELP